MDYQEQKQQEKKKRIWSEVSHLNKWDDEADQSEQALRRQRRETGEQLVRERKQQDSEFREELAKYDLEQVQIFQVAGGRPAQEITPAKKAKCRNSQDKKLGNEAKRAIKERSEQEGTVTKRLQKRVDGTSFQVQENMKKSIQDRNEKMGPYGELQDSADYDVMKYFSDRDPKLVEDYRSNNYEKRKDHLQFMTDRLMAENVNADYFHPENLKQQGGGVQAIVMRYKTFEKVYADPINRPYFEGLSDMEKQLIQTRILDMADLYEKVFRFQCRNLGVDADNGEFLKDDTELAARPEELEAVHNFKEKIQNRDEQTRKVMLDNYEELLDRSKELKANHEEKRIDIETGELTELQGTGLTGFLYGYGPEEVHKIRTLFLDNEEAYKANRPLLSLMEQEFFRVMDARSEYTRKELGNGHAQADVQREGEKRTQTEKEFIKLLNREPEGLILKTTIINNRLEALKEAIKSIIKGVEPESESARKVIEELQQKLDGRNKAVQAQIDEVAAGWAERLLDPVKDRKWKSHERYDGTQDLAEYDDYFTGKDVGFAYIDQLQSRGLRDMLQKGLKDGSIKEMNHNVRTRVGVIGGLNVSRMVQNVEILTVTTGLSLEQGKEILRKLAAGELGERGTEETDRGVAEGLMEYKNALYRHLKGLEAKYGKLLTQLHPEDVLRRINIHQFVMDERIMQDMVQLIDNNRTGIQLFTEDVRDENYAADKEYKVLAGYYFSAMNALNTYIQMHVQCKPEHHPTKESIAMNISNMEMLVEEARQHEDDIQQGPELRASQIPYYLQSVRKRCQESKHPMKKQLYGRW